MVVFVGTLSYLLYEWCYVTNERLFCAGGQYIAG